MRTSQIDTKAVGEIAVVHGWVHRTRDHGGLTFVDVRDFDGIVQCVFDEYKGAVDYHHLRDESAVMITGTVRIRPEGTDNPDLATGEIEIEVRSIDVLNKSEILPFKIFVDGDEEFTASLEQRLKYRYLDLRRKENQEMLMMRSDVMHAVRTIMHGKGFTEVNTPILTASSPEGARDYLVPSRLHPGKFYALPQAPQIFKQLLMASGVEKYFQIAPCFRDEAGRSDRAPGEFYQIDMEMAFATQEEVFDIVGYLLHGIFETYGKYAMTEYQNEWPQIPYAESMAKYGTDKPDLRAGLELIDLTELFRTEGPPFIVDAVKKGQVVKGIYNWNSDDLTGKFYKDAEKYAQELGMPGLGYVKMGTAVTSGATTGGPLAKFMSEEQLEKLSEITGAQYMSNMLQTVFILVGHPKAVNAWGADLRVELSKRTDKFEEESYKFCYVVDYPMFELDDETKKIEFSHNPFSMPQGGMEALDGDPLEVLAHQYDVVCNGVELSSGAIRNHRPDVMLKAFEIAGYDREVVESKFPSLWEAFQYGCPPHGGIAPGFDRILMLLLGKDNIRDVVAFPMNGQAEDLMMGAPDYPTKEQLKELNISIKVGK